MRKILFVILSVVIMLPLWINYYEKEEITKHGQLVLFKIYNNDLKYGLIFYENMIPLELIKDKQGIAVIDIDKNKVASFQRLENQDFESNESKVKFEIKKIRSKDKDDFRIFFGPSHFDPQKVNHENAEFVILKVGKNGKSLFIGFADEFYNPI